MGGAAGGGCWKGAGAGVLGCCEVLGNEGLMCGAWILSWPAQAKAEARRAQEVLQAAVSIATLKQPVIYRLLNNWEAPERGGESLLSYSNSDKIVLFLLFFLRLHPPFTEVRLLLQPEDDLTG